MTNSTYILGKDASLEESISSMQSKLKAIGFNIEEASWLNPVPNVWSVHIRDRDCKACFTNGKGATKKAALASALGEFFERLSCNYFFADWYLGKKNVDRDFSHYPNEKWFPVTEDASLPPGLLDANSLSYYNANNELRSDMLVDLNTGNEEKGICAIPYIRQRDQETVYFPVNVIGNLYVSNGMSAGNTKEEARVQCLSEIFERYVKNKVISEGISLPELPSEVISRYPKVKEAIKKIEESGFPIKCYDASLGGAYPVINVTLINPENGGVFPSYGAHPKLEVALERTVTELLQGRSLDSLDVFEAPSFDLEDVASGGNLEEHFIDSNGLVHWRFFQKDSDYEFSDWNFAGNTQEEFDQLLAILHEMEKEVYICDFNHLDVYSCRIHVPGVSEIYPFEDLVWDNNNSAIELREALLNIKALDNADLKTLWDFFEDAAYNDGQVISELVGVVADPGTVWSELRVGELKAMLALSLSLKEDALESAEWVLHFNQLSPNRAKLYRAIVTILKTDLISELERSDLLDSWQLMFGKECLETAISIVDSEVKFLGMPEDSLNLEGFKNHQLLLEAYEKLQLAKIKHFN